VKTGKADVATLVDVLQKTELSTCSSLPGFHQHQVLEGSGTKYLELAQIHRRSFLIQTFAGSGHSQCAFKMCIQETYCLAKKIIHKYHVDT